MRKLSILGILFLGTALRFHALARQSLWDDEMSSLKMTSLSASQALEGLKGNDLHPPLYFLQLRIWKHLVGSSLAALRANSALWGSCSLWLLFLLAKRLQGPSFGLLAVSLMTLAPFHLAYSQELRPYALAMVEGLLGWLILEEY